ncbi:MAG: polysaccharide export protein [Desulfohalobiaceae bacterium]|nr:polysaccharide export protein [Desulfohalobiaceae bacterium]
MHHFILKAIIVFLVYCTLGLAGTALKAEEYLIGKGDVLEVNVWKEENLTRKLKVRVDGRISLPLVNDIQAAGRSPMELKAEIEEVLSQYIESPEVTVIVDSQISQQFYVIGEVANTGAYPLQKELTLVQAISQVGGFTEWADRDEIILLRRSPEGDKRIFIDFDKIIAGKSSDQNIILQKDDAIIVP